MRAFLEAAACYAIGYGLIGEFGWRLFAFALGSVLVLGSIQMSLEKKKSK